MLYKHLDVTVLHKLILEKYFDINDLSQADREKLVFTRRSSEAVEKVRSGEFQCAFLMNGTRVSDIKDISLANR